MLSVSDTPQDAAPLPGLDRVTALFLDQYGTRPAVVASAPGRVNLIGEHLDYNGGPVLPFAVDRRLWVAVGPAGEFAMVSSAVTDPPVRRNEGPRQGDWSDYLMGVVQELRPRGWSLPAAQVAVVSDIPPGGGLSSSAALCVAGAASLGRLAGWELPADELAEVAYRAEHDYVGVRCGRMDQTVIAHAVQGTAMFFETGSNTRTLTPFPLATWIIATGVDHKLADGGYNARRSECEEALERCRGRWPKLSALAALDPDQLVGAMTLLPAPLDRRVRHVVSETGRTRAVHRALADGNFTGVGRRLVEGHESLRRDFESTVPEADFLVETAVEEGALGARLTGAGWGGSVVMLAPEHGATETIQRTTAAFARRFGRAPAVWTTSAAGGVRVEFSA
jgi:galactokinase